MSEAPVSSRLGWLARRSEAMTEMVRFVAWSLRRMISRERLIGTLALVVVMAATPWILLYAGEWGWIWLALLAAAAVVFALILLISYLKLRLAAADERKRSEAQALLDAEAARASAANDDLARMVTAMERRLSSSVEAEVGKLSASQSAALSQALRLNTDRMDVMRGEIEARVGALRQDFSTGLADVRRDMDARGATLTGALNDLRRNESSRRAELAALVHQAERMVEERAASQLQAMAQLRTELEGMVSAETGASRAQTVALGQAIEARLHRERTEHESSIAETRDQVRGLIEAQEKAGEATAYLRGLIDRRINAGAEALRGELNQLRETMQTTVREGLSMLEPTANELRQSMGEIAARVSELDGFRQEAEKSLADQGQIIGIVRQGVRTDTDALKAAIASEATARKSAIMALAAEHHKTSPAVDDRIAEVQSLIEQRMGPEFEARLESWRARLDNEIASAVQTGRSEDQALAREREAKLRAELKSLHDEIIRQKTEGAGRSDGPGASSEALDQVSKRLQALDEETKATRVKLIAALNSESQKAAEAAVKGLESRLDAVSAEVRAEADKLRLAMAEVRKAGGQAGPKPEALTQIEQRLAEVNTRSNASAQALRRLSDSNASIARPFDRLLAPEKVQRIEGHWLKTFGINMSRSALGYMAHKMCLLEDRGQGRIAAPIETIVMRQLALRSLPNRGKLEVMEIGNLFGLSAAVLYNFRGARSEGMSLTLVDPLEGYYEAGSTDPVTGVEVCEAVLRQNLEQLDVPASDYRLIKSLSADPAAIAAASDRLYDFILVDGDHSTAGVAADFENYGPLVKPGGLMIFDDYGSDHWPGIQPYVDETVRGDPDWVWIGADYRTAIVAKKADGATAKITPPSTSRSAPKSTAKASDKPAAPRRRSAKS